MIEPAQKESSEFGWENMYYRRENKLGIPGTGTKETFHNYMMFIIGLLNNSNFEPPKATARIAKTKEEIEAEKGKRDRVPGSFAGSFAVKDHNPDKQDCHFFSSGRCKSGDACTYRHIKTDGTKKCYFCGASGTKYHTAKECSHKKDFDKQKGERGKGGAQARVGVSALTQEELSAVIEKSVSSKFSSLMTARESTPGSVNTSNPTITQAESSNTKE